MSTSWCAGGCVHPEVVAVHYRVGSFCGAPWGSSGVAGVIGVCTWDHRGVSLWSTCSSGFIGVRHGSGSSRVAVFIGVRHEGGRVRLRFSGVRPWGRLDRPMCAMGVVLGRRVHLVPPLVSLSSLRCVLGVVGFTPVCGCIGERHKCLGFIRCRCVHLVVPWGFMQVPPWEPSGSTSVVAFIGVRPKRPTINPSSLGAPWVSSGSSGLRPVDRPRMHCRASLCSLGSWECALEPIASSFVLALGSFRVAGVRDAPSGGAGLRPCGRRVRPEGVQASVVPPMVSLSSLGCSQLFAGFIRGRWDAP